MGLLDQDPFAPPVPSPLLPAEDEKWTRVLAALDQLAAALRDQPRPEPTVVEVPPVDLSDVVMAVQALKGPATAEEIALALRAVLRPDEPATDGMSVVLEKLAEKLEALEFRLKGNRSVSTGGGFASMTVNGAPVSATNPMPTASLVPFAFDAIEAAYPSSTTETYTYKRGGSTVATVTVTYTNSSKEVLASVARS